MELGITGTQSGMTEAQFNALSAFLAHAPFEKIHGGDCIGFDAECIVLVKEIRPDVKTVGHPPINKSKRAFLEYDELREEKEYIERNHDIVDETEYLIACPKEDKEILRSGTWATVRYARHQDKTVIIIKPDGTWAA